MSIRTFARFTLPLSFLLGCSGDKGDSSSTETTDSETTGTTTTTDSGTTKTTDSGTTKTTDSGTTPTTSCKTDLCATYGGAVPLVAQQIVEAAASDPEFSDFFAPTVSAGPEAVTALEVSLANFISDAYGCSSGAYTGPDMVTVHTGMGITQQQYDDFIAMIAGILQADGVPADDINYCFAPPLVDPAFSATIVGH